LATGVLLSHNASFLTQAELLDLGFAWLGSNVLLHPTTVWVDCSKISLGNHVRIDPFCVVSITARISIGSYVHVGSHCSLSGAGGLVMDDFSCLSHGVKLFSSRDDFSGLAMTNASVPDDLRQVTSEEVRIGRHVVVGAGSVIMPGVTIGEGCAVGALSFVDVSLEPWGIYAGVPARRIRDRQRDLLSLEAKLREEGA
jgi:acetyltransferase-like isoleucine patch superfamily enzyme